MTENNQPKTIENETLKSQILERLEMVIDPELGVDIVNLGLVYDVVFYENGTCEIRITLTTVGCPFADVIEEDIKNVLKSIEEIKEVLVKLVWYPAWNPSKMSRYARIALGIR